jgi:DNA-binding transcriptional regulator GbsR (MarR family)
MPARADSSNLSAPLNWDREVRRFIEAGGNTTHAFGLGRLIGRMFALLYLNPQPLSLEEIADKLDISKAGASTTVRQLEEWKAVRCTPVPGDRRDFYEAETGFGIILKNGLLPGLRKKLNSAGTQIGRTLDARPAEEEQPVPEGYTASEFEEIRKRLHVARGLHQKLESILSSSLLEHFI